MSVRCITQVLDSSQHAGTDLLMMVVLADYSDDDGNSYPAVASLARKCRMTPRNANYILHALQASGELKVLKNEGPKGTNRYRIMLSVLGQQPLKPASPLKGASPLKPTSGPPEAGFRKPLKPTSDEPSLNRQEPSSTSAEPSAVRLPACPHRKLIALFVEKVPELPKPKPELWMGKNATAMQARWKWVLTAKRESGERYATTEAEALAWFGRFFERVQASDFLTGRDDAWTGCSLGWLMKAENFAKVVSGNYVNRSTA